MLGALRGSEVCNMSVGGLEEVSEDPKGFGAAVGGVLGLGVTQEGVTY